MYIIRTYKGYGDITNASSLIKSITPYHKNTSKHRNNRLLG